MSSQAVRHTLPPSSERRLIADIGGASTELIIGRSPSVSLSMLVASTHLSNFSRMGKIAAKSLKNARQSLGAHRNSQWKLEMHIRQCGHNRHCIANMGISTQLLMVL